MGSRKTNWLVIAILPVVLPALGCRHARPGAPSLAAMTETMPSVGPTTEPTRQKAPTPADTWSCPMHARIRQPQPGKCPICGMDLILSDDPSMQAKPVSAPGHSHSSESGDPLFSAVGCSHCG